jgi:hypothetical protein
MSTPKDDDSSSAGPSTTTRLPVEALWVPEEVAAFLRVPVRTLYQWRWRGEGPPVRKVGRHLRYDPGEVRAWFAALDRTEVA